MKAIKVILRIFGAIIALSACVLLIKHEFKNPEEKYLKKIKIETEKFGLIEIKREGEKSPQEQITPEEVNKLVKEMGEEVVFYPGDSKNTVIIKNITTYQGIDYSLIYKPQYYYLNNKKAREQYGTDARALIKHFITEGIYGGEQGIGSFDLVSYFLFNADLREIYSNNLSLYVYHYLNNKENECRPATGKHDMALMEQVLFDMKPEIEKQTIYALNSVGWDLYSAFEWAAYIPYITMPLNWSPESYALFTFGNWGGNCLGKACAFYYMARQLGYNAHVVRGYVPLLKGGYNPHGWVEIDGYVYDPDFEGEKGLNGFQIWYGQPGTWAYTDYWYMT